jgi:hypothetical protein
LREDEAEHQKHASNERTGNGERPAKRCASREIRQVHEE